MKYDVIYVTFGEIFLKGKNKRLFVKRTVKTVADKIADLRISVSHTDDRIIIELGDCPAEAVAQRLGKIFGLYSYAFCKICKNNIEDICETALETVRCDAAENIRIKIETKRAWKKFPMKSPDISKRVADFIADKFNADFAVSNPDETVSVIIKPHFTLVSLRKFFGLGGLPIGISGKALLMLSGGIDSPVAGYLTMRRGLVLDCIHFESPPHTSVKAKQKVFDIAEKLAHYLPEGRINIYCVPFTKLQKEIFAKVPQNYTMIIMRRMMLRIADLTARKYNISLIANGENIGQVASQTPQSMNAVNAVTNMPVLRPLACMDKNEIVKTAKEIDTFEISIRPYEDCCTVFVPPNPITVPTAERAEKFESHWNWTDLLEECVRDTQTTVITAGNPMILDEETNAEICKLFD